MSEGLREMYFKVIYFIVVRFFSNCIAETKLAKLAFLCCDTIVNNSFGCVNFVSALKSQLKNGFVHHSMYFHFLHF